MKQIISFYKFVKIEDLQALRTELKTLTNALDLKGTILVAPEGINSTISGESTQIQEFQQKITQDPRFADLTFKQSEYAGEAFRRMLVRLKKEVITIKLPVDPVTDNKGDYISPEALNKLLESKEEVVMLDTRNDYEVSLGTFKNALDPDITTFSQFTDYCEDHKEQLAQKTIVTFCTGGIRCEKATAMMKHIGYENVYQLEGGILNYFKVVQDKNLTNYWDGECTVFDKRKAVDTNLQPTEKHLCFVCLRDIAQRGLGGQHGAGDACRPCHESIETNHEKRQQQGLSKQIAHRQKRDAARSARC